jgi:hypothetical protein
MLSFGLRDETVPAESIAASLSDWRVDFEASLKASDIHMIVVYPILMGDAKKHLGRSGRVVIHNNVFSINAPLRYSPYLFNSILSFAISHSLTIILPNFCSFYFLLTGHPPKWIHGCKGNP